MELKNQEGRLFDRTARSRIALGVLVVSVVAVVVAVLANVALTDYSKTHDVRFDLTAQNRHELTEATVELVRGLKSPVEVYVTYGVDASINRAARADTFSNRPDSGILDRIYLPLLDYLAARITDVANECRLLNSNFKYRVSNASRDFDTPREWARRFGVDGKDIINRVVFFNPETQAQKSFSFYEIFKIDLGGPMANQPRRMPMERGDFIEAVVTLGLKTVVHQERRIAYVTRGHKETELPALDVILKGEGFDVRLTNPSSTGVVPRDCDVLVIAGGGDPWTPHALKGVQNYLNGGGRVLLLQGRECREFFQPVLEPFGVRSRRFQTGHATAHPRGAGPYDLYGWDFLGPMKKSRQPHRIVSRLVKDRNPLHFGFVRPYELLVDFDREAVERRVLAHVGSDGHAVPFRFDGRTNRQRTDLGIENGDAPFMLALERQQAGLPPSRIVACGGDQWMGERELLHDYNLGNLDLLRNSINWLTDSGDTMSGTPRQFRGHRVQLDQGDARTFRLMTVGLLPVAILLVGLIVFLIRRR